MKTFENYTVRSATADDQWAIRWLVLSSGLEPTQLRWFQFWVMEMDGRIIGCGQLRQFEDAQGPSGNNIQELGSLVMARSHRHQGLGRALAQHLIQQASLPLYLECLGQRLVTFYSQLGFKVIELADLPSCLRRKFAFTQYIARMLPFPLVIMRYDP